VSSAWRIGVDLVGERHRSAERTQASAAFDDGRDFRVVPEVDEGDLSAVILGVRRPMPDARADDWSAGVHVEIGAFDDGYYLRPTAHASLRRSSADHSRDVMFTGSAGLVTADAPSQRVFLIGGTGTVAGYPFRSFAGHRYALLDAQYSHGLVEPWVRIRLVGAAGVAGGSPSFDAGADPPTRAWQAWNLPGTNGLRSSLGGGLSLFWDVLRIDAVRGLNGGDWHFVISFHPDLLDIG
jgi:hypothetical protein